MKSREEIFESLLHNFPDQMKDGFVLGSIMKAVAVEIWKSERRCRGLFWNSVVSSLFVLGVLLLNKFGVI